jgi:DNA repair protein RecN (Recombination protein N)
MLKRLSIQNFAIIKQLQVSFHEGYNVITGETGAGKSILIDALGLILGDRADLKSQIDSAEKCVIEGEFLNESSVIKKIFEQLELDYESPIIIRREFSKQGKSRAFVNDTPVTVVQLKKVAENLVSIHSQHENMVLSDAAFQFNLLDTFAQNKEVLFSYQKVFTSYKQEEKTLAELKKKQSEMLKEKDYLAFLVNEFDTLQLKSGEESEIDKELQLLNHAEQIKQTAEYTGVSISDSEQSVIVVLTAVKQKLKGMASYSEVCNTLYERVSSVIIELKDIAIEANDLLEKVGTDQSRLEELNDRMNAIYQLKRKHNVSDFEELLSVYENIATQLNGIGSIEQQIAESQKKVDEAIKEMSQLAKKIHQSRIKSASLLKQDIEHYLHQLEMPKSVVMFEINENETFNEFGNSHLAIKFSANVGILPQALDKVASGGELSRLALAIRTIEAKSNQLGTLIFDEIDTGVSGKVAANIGSMFKSIAMHHQLIAITHLPQVAASGQYHYFVSKSEKDNKTYTQIHQLSNTERIEQLANMLSGNAISESAMQNAKELLKQA